MSFEFRPPVGESQHINLFQSWMPSRRTMIKSGKLFLIGVLVLAILAGLSAGVGGSMALAGVKGIKIITSLKNIGDWLPCLMVAAGTVSLIAAILTVGGYIGYRCYRKHKANQVANAFPINLADHIPIDE